MKLEVHKKVLSQKWGEGLESLGEMRKLRVVRSTSSGVRRELYEKIKIKDVNSEV